MPSALATREDDVREKGIALFFEARCMIGVAKPAPGPCGPYKKAIA